MTDEPHTDVLVIGAGPTGLTLACDLARRGVAHRIVERDPLPNRASKAKTIQSRSLEVLDDLGAVDHVLRRGVAGLPLRFHEPTGAIVDRPSISVRAKESFSTPYPDALWIGQFDVERALRERLEDRGGRVEFATEAVGLDQDDTGVTVTLRTPGGRETVRARYVVGADGGRSGTRGLIGLPLNGETYEQQRWYLGDVTGPDLDRDHIHIWPSAHGMLGLTPLPGSDLWQFQSPIAPGAEPGVPSRELYQQLLDERAGAGSVVLSGATWLSVYRVNVRMVEDYRKGRVLLAGDAAHVHSPAGGQGMNTGIQDAYNLGWKLAGVLVEGADPSLLDTYAAERIPVARTVLAASTEKMRRVVGQADRGSEDGLGTALSGIADGAMTTGLGIRYRTSPLTQHGAPEPAPEPGSEPGSEPGPRLPHDPLHDLPPGPLPGDRAPNVGGLKGRAFTADLSDLSDITDLRVLSEPSDLSVLPDVFDLFDLLRGPHWSLLAYEHPEPVTRDRATPTRLHVHRIGRAPDSDVVDAEGEFRRTYRPLPGELILIRPDGHIAARLPARRATEIIRHLAPFRLLGNHVGQIQELT
ncbi:FAD-dependent monooxygenase [Streptomyces bluensis]|uniref:FAD-dependent monooxygenase n=1 Tax=Streptomyces bluensis TaxID=33897 RepID=UPI00167BF531|nr:FAD-dependent monooxygenase [Streptomyces bluensis]